MVVKGSARGAPGELALHLLRADTNESVRVVELSGVAADNLCDALLEMDGMGAGSRSKRPLYHASINTPISEQLSPDEQIRARERLAKELGLVDQPFAVVEHVKHGRQHTHVVWSRIDSETGRAIPDSHNYRKHEVVSRELEVEFNHRLVPGAHIRDKKNEPRPERGPTWGEQRQAERSGMTPQEAKSIVSDCWRQADTGTAFQSRLEEAGFTLARGDRRDFVLIDHAGEIHSLSRRVEGVKAAQIRERMADVDTDQLPTVEQARIRALQAAQQSQQESPKFVGTVERLHAEEQREGQSRNHYQAPLTGTAGDIADAVRQLNRTMRNQVEQTIVSKPAPETQAAFKQDLKTQVVPEPRKVPPDVPVDRPADKTAEPELAQQQRSSSALFERMRAWVIARYERLLDSAPERMKGKIAAPAEPRTPPSFDPQFAKEDTRAAGPKPEASPASPLPESGQTREAQIPSGPARPANSPPQAGRERPNPARAPSPTTAPADDLRSELHRRRQSPNPGHGRSR